MTAQRDTIIRIADVSRWFGTALAVAGVTLDLRDGEFFCLLGPSGCGKSTLLRILAGFERADAGRIELDGQDLTAVPPHKRPVNMMFQSYALFPHMTVAGNIAYGLKRAGFSRAEREARVAELVRLVRLEGLEDRHPARLSGGQKQRVALARALARRPRVLLLDEPLGALDRALREQTQAELKDLQSRLGTTFVTVTHDQDEAMALSDRVGIMEAGRLVQVGTPREVYERPNARFVAGFLGAANLLEGQAAGVDSGRARLVLPGGGTIVGEAANGLRSGYAAACIRPERIAIVAARAAPGSGGAWNHLPGVVTGTTYLGNATTVRIRLAGGEDLRATLRSSDTIPAVGDEVTAVLPPEAIRLLP